MTGTRAGLVCFFFTTTTACAVMLGDTCGGGAFGPGFGAAHGCAGSFTPFPGRQAAALAAAGRPPFAGFGSAITPLRQTVRVRPWPFSGARQSEKARLLRDR